MTPQGVLLTALVLLEKDGWANVWLHEPEGWSIHGAINHILYPNKIITDPDEAHAAAVLQEQAFALLRPFFTWTNYGPIGWDMAEGLTGEYVIAAVRIAAARG